MAEIDFMSSLHKSTSRDYLARVNDKEFPKPKAAKIAKAAFKNGTTLKHEVIKSGLINEKEYDKIMSPIKMTKPK